MDRTTSTYDAADASGATGMQSRLKKPWSDPRLDEIAVADITLTGPNGCIDGGYAEPRHACS